MRLVYRLFWLISELLFRPSNVTFRPMGRKLAVAVLTLLALPVEGRSAAPLYDPVVLNVGVNCRWQQTCQRRQIGAMARARGYIAHAHPPLWRIHLCNRNAHRGTANVDWVGFDNCIRNTTLTPRGGRLLNR